MSLSDWFLTPTERDNPHSVIDAAHPDGAGWTTGNSVRAIVHGTSYFAELHEQVTALQAGDRLYFVDWRGDPDQQLTDDPAQTLTATLTGAARRGVEVRGLLWRSHWRHFGFQSGQARYLGEEIEQAGGQCLRDMRVRTAGAHHQKFVVLRHRDDPSRDIAYVGGIDLCHSRRDDADHHGDRQALPIAAAYGPTPAWHDVQVAVQGPAVHDVETTFRERWEDHTPLTLNPGRMLSSLLQGEDQTPRPLGPQWPPPPTARNGHDAVQIVRSYPKILPQGFDFAPDGERTIALANTKAVARAERLIYVEDQYFWGEEVGEHFATALRANPDLRLVIILPTVPDLDGLIGEKTQFYARRLALETVLEAGGDRVAVFGLCNGQALPVYVHAKVCVIDDRWASVGSDNLNRRSWSSDSEIACLVVDERATCPAATGPAAVGSFPLALRTELLAEHLGCSPDELPDDPHELFDQMVASAEALDAWYARGAGHVRTGLRSLPGRAARHTRRRKGHRMGRARVRIADSAADITRRATDAGERPPGQLRRLALPELTSLQQRWAAATYVVFDPDGTIGRDEDLMELVTTPTQK